MPVQSQQNNARAKANGVILLTLNLENQHQTNVRFLSTAKRYGH